MDKEQLISLVLLAFTIMEPGYCFLFKRSKELDNGDSIAHLKRRYWNDDIQPCIEKYCLPYHGKKLYIKCLQHYCPAGLLTVPRDLDAMSLFPVAMILGDTEFCAEDFLNNSPPMVGNLDADCTSGRCEVENLLAATGADDGSASTFKYGVYNLCRASLCKDVHGDAHFDCVRQRCCGQDHDADAPLSMRKRVVNTMGEPRPFVATKRRVNDEVTQCIQSYCSGSQGKDRLICIVKNCNRA